ncbi:OTU protein [Datura stramonium]|uniref:Ubiquitin thioesterase OTU n=1 Tax=Datura stramonium TaxID=4076 RepID=A0ABS8THI1_DATST|nr:OTU protein [Datura stramonium]
MEGSIVRRVIPSDNSCLFNAVGLLLQQWPVIQKNILMPFLQPNKEYCDWILNPEKWGGAIELSILADHYGREIAAYDIQTTRCDLYGQGKNYQERVMLIYDGLHYDALAMSPADGAPEEFDQTIFSDQQRKRSYTDTANFTLRCGVCQIGVVGQKEAVEHAQATGHGSAEMGIRVSKSKPEERNANNGQSGVDHRRSRRRTSSN